MVATRILPIQAGVYWNLKQRVFTFSNRHVGRRRETQKGIMMQEDEQAYAQMKPVFDAIAAKPVNLA